MITKLWQINTLFLWWWYSCFRWTWLKNDKWLYTPINLTTAFLSIFILSISIAFYYVPILQYRILLNINLPSMNYIIFILCSLVIWLAFRNGYYTGEDILDLKTLIIAYKQHSIKLGEVLQQLLFIIIDLLMLAWCIKWLNVVLAIMG